MWCSAAPAPPARSAIASSRQWPAASASAANPYPEACAKPQYLHLWFLEKAPTAAATRSLEAVRLLEMARGAD
jgi:hypothetical protein